MFEEVTVLGVEYLDFVGQDGKQVCGSKIWYVRDEDHGQRTICGVIPAYLWQSGIKVTDLLPGNRYNLYYEPTAKGVRPSYFALAT